MNCVKICNRGFCWVNECLHSKGIKDINNIIFNEHIGVLSRNAHRGELVTDLYKLIKKYNEIEEKEQAMKDLVKHFDSINNG